MATPAPAALRALADATARWPSRPRRSDGIIADQHHAPTSDHARGDAVDITHDPESCDGDIIAGHAVADERTAYVIWHRRIWSRRRATEGWRAYQRAHPHTGHVHISLDPAKRADSSPWGWLDPGADGPARARASRLATGWTAVLVALALALVAGALWMDRG